MSDRFHKAARDGYLDLLREINRKEANSPDEDGMTPTLWAAYYGNLDALRLIVGRGGEPDKCDHFGNCALHCAAANGHVNCVSFLVNFGANLWALDNDFHTPMDLAGMNERMEIVRYLDAVTSKQESLNKKVVNKLKERAVLAAKKRVKEFDKLHKLAQKKAELFDKKLEKDRRKMEDGPLINTSDSASIHSSVTARNSISETIRGTITGTLRAFRKESNVSSVLNSTPRFSDLVVGTHKGTRRQTSGAAKKIQQKKHENGDFKVAEIEPSGQRSIRSLTGLRSTDPEVIYVTNVTDEDSSGVNNQRRHMKDLFDEPISLRQVNRAISEPDLAYNADSGYGDEIIVEPASLFERPGFGTVAFRAKITSGALLSLPAEGEEDDDKDSVELSNDGSHHRSNSVVDSIGSAGSLAQRNQNIPWDEEDLNLDDDAESSPLELFLAAHKLSEFIPLFSREKLDLDALLLCTDDDLKSIGLQLGPRRKLLDAIERRKSALNVPEVFDSRL